MHMRLELLGSGAVRANPRRGGTAQLVRLGERLILVDAGRAAVQALARTGAAVESIERVFISHLHFDHICDLPLLMLLGWNNGRSAALPLVGPAGLAHFIDRAQEAYRDDIASRKAHGKDTAGLACQVQELTDPGVVYGDEDVTVHAIFTEHAGLANVSYRFDAGVRRLAILSDTAPDPALVAFCRDVDLLVCECSGTREFLRQRPWGHWHMDPPAIAELARESGARRVVLKHLVMEDWVDDPHLAEKLAHDVTRGYAGPVDAGYDGLVIDLPG